jgi:hypothetical protein
MSILNDFMRIRLFRKQAAEFNWMADNASAPTVQRRYRSIARHYSELAEREEQADKVRIAECLEQLRRKREQTAARVSLISRPVNDNAAADAFSDPNPLRPLASLQGLSGS